MSQESSRTDFIGHYDTGTLGEFRADLPAHDPGWMMRFVLVFVMTCGIGLGLLYMSAVYGDTGVIQSRSPYSTGGGPSGSQRNLGLALIVFGLPLSFMFGRKSKHTDFLEVSGGSLCLRAGQGKEHFWPLQDIEVEIKDSRLRISRSQESESIALFYPQQELSYLCETLENYRSGKT